MTAAPLTDALRAHLPREGAAILLVRGPAHPFVSLLEGLAVTELALPQEEHHAALPEGCWDAALIVDALERLEEPWALLLHLHDRLAPSGRLLIVAPNIAWAPHVSALLRGEECSTGEGHIRFFTPASLTAVLEKAGFAVLGLHAAEEPGGESALLEEALDAAGMLTPGRAANLRSPLFLVAAEKRSA